MRRPASLGVTLSLCLVLAQVPSATGVLASQPAALPGNLSSLIDRAEARSSSVEANVARLREAAASGVASEMAAEIFSVAGRSVSEVRPERPVGGRTPWNLALTGEQAHAVAAIGAAIERAVSQMGTLPAREVREAYRQYLITSSRLVFRGGSLLGPASAGQISARGNATGSSYSLPASVERAAAAAPRASLDVLRTVEQNLPALARISAPRAAQEPVAGCDVVNQPPLLCVSSSLDNVYEKNAALIIDLGGNDVYRNNAGISPFLPEGGSAFVPVGISVDLAGDDSYRAMADQLIDGVSIATGGAFMGGIGISVDYAGNDQYVAHIPNEPGEPSLPGAGFGLALVIGQGGGSYSGSGLLLDLGGSDAYSVLPPVEPKASENRKVTAQGGGETCGGTFYVSAPPYRTPTHCPSTGALIDTGRGNDAYAIDLGDYAASEIQKVHTTWAQGAGSAGAGFLVDDGGSDSVSIRSVQHGVPSYTGVGEDAPEAHAHAPNTFMWAQGAAAGGLGIVSFGQGDTTYSMHVSADELAITTMTGQGAGALGGVAALDDAGGNDLYEMRSDAVLNPVTQVPPDCGIEKAIPCDAGLLVDAHYGLTQRNLYGQGYGGAGGLGVLLDASGNDTYRGSNSIELNAKLIDNAASGEGVPSMRVEGFWGPGAMVQGLGASGGLGLLADAGGTDTYLHEVENVTTARVESHDGRKPLVTALDAGRRSVGQGSGFFGGTGVLLDAGGSGDRVLSEAVNQVVTEPNPNGAFRWGGGSGSGAVQGAGDGGVLAVLGTSPTVLSSPNKPACVLYGAGNRGFAYWHECSSASIGAGPRAQTWDPPSYNVPPGGGYVAGALGQQGIRLQFTTDTVSAIQPDYSEQFDANTKRVPVAVQVTKTDGTPVPDQLIHLMLQFGACLGQCPAGEADTSRAWYGLWQSDAVTDSSGVARAELPVAFPVWTQNVPPPGKARVVATFDGAPGVHPMHEAKVLTIGS